MSDESGRRISIEENQSQDHNILWVAVDDNLHIFSFENTILVEVCNFVRCRISSRHRPMSLGTPVLQLGMVSESQRFHNWNDIGSLWCNIIHFWVCDHPYSESNKYTAVDTERWKRHPGSFVSAWSFSKCSLYAPNLPGLLVDVVHLERPHDFKKSWIYTARIREDKKEESASWIGIKYNFWNRNWKQWPYWIKINIINTPELHIRDRSSLHEKILPVGLHDILRHLLRSLHFFGI